MNMETLRNLNRRYFMFILLILIIIPAVNPIGIPIPVSDFTREVYDYIEGLPDDSLIVIACNVGVALWPEEETFAKAVLWQLGKIPVKFVIVNFGADSPVLMAGALEDLDYDSIFPDKKYGEDYALMGFLAGAETAMASFATNPGGAYETDYFGTPVGQLPIMQELQTTSDIDLIVHITGADADAPVRQWVETFHIPYAAAPTIGWVPTYSPYYDAGQLIGLIAGIRGGAEYELLIDRPSSGLAITDGLSLAFLYTVLLIILGNIDNLLKEKPIKGGTI
jgi:hypothetical protein